MYRPVTYANAGKPGPALVVIDGLIKSDNATFTQKVTSNNIADYAELELSKAGFKVLERSDLGALKREFQIAYTAGDPDTARKLLGKGKFKATRWVLRFDVLKAEPVAAAQRGFDGGTIGALAGGLVGGRAGYGTAVGVGSVHSSDAAGVWIVGMRYTVIDARTTEQAATGYFEQKMEIGATSRSVLGVSSSNQGGLTLDSLTQRLVQESVAEIDAKYK
jgi:curli biogenesis system outer membrane secretion channel CsgG